MLRKSALISIVVLVTLLLPLSVSAEENASKSSTVKEKTLREVIKPIRMELKDQIDKKREAFKEKLATIKDQRKKEIATRLDTRIPEINKNRTTQMSAALSRMTQLLDTMSSKAATAKKENKNTSSFDTAVIAAKTAIATAQTAVTTQAEKTYPLTITDETTMKTTIGTTLKLLMTDLRAVHQKVTLARDGVKKAAQELATLRSSLHNGKEHTATPAAE